MDGDPFDYLHIPKSRKALQDCLRITHKKCWELQSLVVLHLLTLSLSTLTYSCRKQQHKVTPHSSFGFYLKGQMTKDKRNISFFAEHLYFVSFLNKISPHKYILNNSNLNFKSLQKHYKLWATKRNFCWLLHQQHEGQKTAGMEEQALKSSEAFQINIRKKKKPHHKSCLSSLKIGYLCNKWTWNPPLFPYVRKKTG